VALEHGILTLQATVSTAMYDSPNCSRWSPSARPQDFSVRVHAGHSRRRPSRRGSERAIETGGDYTAEYRVLLKNGSVRWLHARGRGQLKGSGSPSRFTGVVFDITERKVAALRNAFLVRLDDVTRLLNDPHEITQAAAQLLGEHLNVNRCAYADVEADQDMFNLTGDYNRGVPSIVGRYTFTQFGTECLRLMRAGKP
jgi:hypothetical protein